MSYPQSYPEEFEPQFDSTEEYLNWLELAYPWWSDTPPPTGSLAEKLAEEAQWGDDNDYEEDDDAEGA